MTRSVEKNQERVKQVFYAFLFYAVLVGLGLVVKIINIIGFLADSPTIMNFDIEFTSEAFAILGIVAFFILARNFAYWFKELYAHLKEKYTVRYKVSMAFWSWFIPVLWWFRPFQIFLEIERLRVKNRIAKERTKFDQLWIRWICFLIYFWLGLLFDFIIYGVWSSFHLASNYVFFQYSFIAVEVLSIIAGVVSGILIIKLMPVYQKFELRLTESKSQFDISDHLIEDD